MKVYKLQKHENGLIAVKQHKIGALDITFNPDDDRFYVVDNDNETVATFNRFSNAVAYCKRRLSENISR